MMGVVLDVKKKCLGISFEGWLLLDPWSSLPGGDLSSLLAIVLASLAALAYLLTDPRGDGCLA